LFLNIPAVGYVEEFLETFKDYPPRQKAEGMAIQQTLEKLKQGAGGK